MSLKLTSCIIYGDNNTYFRARMNVYERVSITVQNILVSPRYLVMMNSVMTSRKQNVHLHAIITLSFSLLFRQTVIRVQFSMYLLTIL